MPKRTKKQTLLRCRKIWQWLADNPGVEYFYVEKRKAYEALNLSQNDFYSCPCCEHFKSRGFRLFSEEGCQFRGCLLKWGKKPTPNIVACERPSSPYARWSKAKTAKTRKKYAAQIVALCDKALEELEEKQCKN